LRYNKNWYSRESEEIFGVRGQTGNHLRRWKGRGMCIEIRRGEVCSHRVVVDWDVRIDRARLGKAERERKKALRYSEKRCVTGKPSPQYNP
jgi:hypothetical protein